MFEAFPGYLHIYHNDTPGIRFFDRFVDAGVHILNYSHLADMRSLDAAIGDRICLMGNIPPMEVLVNGASEDVRRSAQICIDAVSSAFFCPRAGAIARHKTGAHRHNGPSCRRTLNVSYCLYKFVITFRDENW